MTGAVALIQWCTSIFEPKQTKVLLRLGWVGVVTIFKFSNFQNLNRIPLLQSACPIFYSRILWIDVNQVFAVQFPSLVMVWLKPSQLLSVYDSKEKENLSTNICKFFQQTVKSSYSRSWSIYINRPITMGSQSTYLKAAGTSSGIAVSCRWADNW